MYSPRLLALAIVLGFCLTGQAQNFVNGDLNGTVGVSSTPTSWAQVPFTDIFSDASGTAQATSDVTSTTGPISGNINCNPYSGTTLVTGLNMSITPSLWHEGLQQSVGGLTIGNAYTISFWQTVAKQSNATDNTGSWSVYRDNTAIATSAPTTSTLPPGSNARTWERRTMTFVATATSHLFKFLPRDDDVNIESPDGVRMGIDSINLRNAAVLPMALTFQLAKEGDAVRLTWQDGAPGVMRYVIERSLDGLRFAEAGRVEAGGFSTYRFLDAHPYLETHYRIARVEADGGMVYSEVQSIQVKAGLMAELYGRTLQLYGGDASEYDLAIYDVQGRCVYNAHVGRTVDLSAIQGGVYVVKVTGRNGAMLDKRILLVD